MDDDSSQRIAGLAESRKQTLGAATAAPGGTGPTADSPTRALIKEEGVHLEKARHESRSGGLAPAARDASGHAEQQVQRAVTIRHYEQVLDAALRNVTPDLLFPEMLERIRTLLEVDMVTVFLVDEGGHDLYARASVGLEQAVKAGIRIPIGHGIAGAVIASRQTRTLYDVNEHTVANPLLIEMGIQSLVAVPILVAELAIGVLTAGCISGRRFERGEIRLLEVVSDRVALAIERTTILRQVEMERERAERASRFKTTLLHMATHDIKTPLTTMRLQLQMIKMPNIAPEVKAKALAVVDRSIRSMEVILDDFLDLARIDAGRFRLQLTTVDLWAVADEIVQMFIPLANGKKLELRLVGRPVEVEADQRRLSQVLVNLVSNAIRYTRQGSVVVRVGAEEGAPAAPGTTRIEVEDTGQGMDADQIALLFRPFGTVHAGPQEGTGLGLHLAKVIIDAHGGTIGVRSAGPGKGTKGTVDLPLRLTT